MVGDIERNQQAEDDLEQANLNGTSKVRTRVAFTQHRPNHKQNEK